jgi:hypothetical protein
VLQQGEYSTDNYGVSVEFASNVLRGLQYIRFGSEQNEGVDAGSESGIDGHDATLTQVFRIPYGEKAQDALRDHDSFRVLWAYPEKGSGDCSRDCVISRVKTV